MPSAAEMLVIRKFWADLSLATILILIDVILAELQFPLGYSEIIAHVGRALPMLLLE